MIASALTPAGLRAAARAAGRKWVGIRGLSEGLENGDVTVDERCGLEFAERLQAWRLLREPNGLQVEDAPLPGSNGVEAGLQGDVARLYVVDGVDAHLPPNEHGREASLQRRDLYAKRVGLFEQGREALKRPLVHTDRSSVGLAAGIGAGVVPGVNPADDSTFAKDVGAGDAELLRFARLGVDHDPAGRDDCLDYPGLPDARA